MDFHDRELEVAFSFLDFIQSQILRGVGCDSPHRYLNGNGQFDIWSFYNKIRCTSIPSFPWKGISKVKVPKRVAFFMWTTAHGWILTLDTLMLQGLPLVNQCYMCCHNEESVDHLLYTILQLTLCGCKCYKFSGSNGSCQALWRVWCFVRVIGWRNFFRTYGIWFLVV